MNQELHYVDNEKDKSAKTITTVVYALQAASFLFGGITFLIAIIVNYVKRMDVQGTWLESHFRWQMRTFWFSLVLTILSVITLPLGIGYFIFVVTVIWVIYRIVKGWVRLSDRKKMYVF
ncbi:MAG: hypothetical protein KJO08_03425 [Gammaproteobacteria bacterium]|nr:hypothetical protein [Gammaproteobacteria bacterium]